MAATLAVAAAPARTGIDLFSVAVAAGASLDTFANDSTAPVHFFVNNGGASPITLTLVFSSSVNVDGQVPPNHTVSVTNGHFMILGPFPNSQYNDPTTSLMTIQYSSSTSVKVYAYKAQ